MTGAGDDLQKGMVVPASSSSVAAGDHIFDDTHGQSRIFLQRSFASVFLEAAWFRKGSMPLEYFSGQRAHENNIVCRGRRSCQNIHTLLVLPTFFVSEKMSYR